MFNKFFLLLVLTVLTLTSSMAMDPLRVAGQASSTNVKDVTLDVTIKVYDSANHEIYHVDIPSIYFDNQCVFSFVWNASEITYNPLYNVKIENSLNGIVLFECRLDKLVNAQTQFGAFIDPVEINGTPTAGTILTSNGTTAYWASPIPALVTGDLVSTTNGVTITGGDGSVIGAGTTVDIATATTSITGLLTSADWNIFKGKQDALTAGTGINLIGNVVTNTAPDQTVVLTGAGTNVVTGTYPNFTITSTEVDGSITNETNTSLTWTDATNTIAVVDPAGTQSVVITGFESTLAKGNLTTTTGAVTITGGDGSVIGAGTTVDIATATTSITGLLTSADWNIFKGKQDALTAGTGISLISNVVTNTAPDQTVVITGAGTNVVTGTYPNFTITSTEVDGSITNETNTSLTWTDATNTIGVVDPAGTQSVVITGFESTLTKGDLTTTTGAVTITGGLGSVIGTGTTVDIATATTSITGLLTSADWNIFKGKQDALTAGTGISLISNVVTNTAPDQTVVITGAGTNVVTGTYPNFTITSTEVDGSITNETNTSLTWTDATNTIAVVDPAGTQSVVITGFESTLTKGDLTTTTGAVTITGGVGSVIGTGTTVNIATAGTSTTGLLTGADWNIFKGKQDALTAGTGISLISNVVTNTAPDQTVVITGAGTNVVTGTYPNFTITSTEVDGSITNETNTSLTWTDATNTIAVVDPAGTQSVVITGFESTLTKGNLTTTTGAVTITGGVGSVIGTGTTVDIATSNGSIAGLLTSADWNTFNGKQNALTAGTGISLIGNVVTNTAPDQTVVLTGAGTSVVTGTYPNFTITSTEVDGSITNETNTSLTWTDATNTIAVVDPAGTKSVVITGFESTLTKGNLTTTTGAVTITGGDGSVIGAGTTVDIATATTSITGLLTSTDWNTFNGKQDALGFTPENVANKVTTISGASTDVQYSSAKLLYDQLLLKANLSGAAFTGAISAPTYNGYTLPTVDGTSGQVLTTNGAGGTTWTTPSGTSTTAYAYCYDNVGGTLPANTDIALDSNGVMSNITHTLGSTGITVTIAGDYKIDYGINVDNNIGAALAISINDFVEESSRIYFVSAIQNYASSVILSLAANDVIKLRNASAVVINRPAVGVNTHIVITKIN